jgi:hypothetical protein
MAVAGVDILFAAGNWGSGCPDPRCKGHVVATIAGANALGEALTVVTCDIDDNWACYSSLGPGIAGMAHQKPNIASFTNFIGSEAMGRGFPGSGTSAAAPVAAGCVAAPRTRLTPAAMPPAQLFVAIGAAATPVGAPGWGPKFGCGVVDAAAAAQGVGLMTS